MGCAGPGLCLGQVSYKPAGSPSPLLQDSLLEAVLQEQGQTLYTTGSLLPGQKIFPATGPTELVPLPEYARPYGIRPFYWGLGLSVPGAIYVYYKTRERQPTQRAIGGAVVNGLIVGALFFVLTSR